MHGKCPEFAEAARSSKASGQFVLSPRQAATEIKAISMHNGQSGAGYYLCGVATCPVAVTCTHMQLMFLVCSKAAPTLEKLVQSSFF